jgi:metal-sulfur cluster biosynthetic enzyme
MKVTESMVIEKLKEVYDPELGISVYDLGLIYKILPLDDIVNIRMTLTTPGCPLHDSIISAVEHAVLSIPGVKIASVDLVWEPAWKPLMMSKEAKSVLGHK